MAERKKPKFKFQAKILIPVVIVMVLFLVATLWMINSLIQSQLRVENRVSLFNTETLVTNAFERRAAFLIEQFGPTPDDSGFSSIAQHLDRAPNDEVWRKTMIHRFGTILGSTPVEGTGVILFTDPAGQLLASTNRVAGLNTEQFYSSCAPLVAEALKAGKTNVRTIQMGGSLFDVVAVPCSDSPPERNLFGALIFAVEINNTAARQFKFANSDISFIANDRVVASTIGTGDLDPELLREYHKLTASNSRTEDAGDLSLVLRDEHFGALPGRLPFYGRSDVDAGYLLLSSYEQSWRSFRQVQRVLLLFSIVGIVLGTAIVWMVIRRVTEPLRQLRDSAEAVGRGDFSRRIDIQSDDELGELAAVFNHTTENLQRSTAQLEETVETLRTTQAQLVHSEKLSAVGEFVAGVAHELNNPLTALIGFAELVQMGAVDDETRSSLQRISNSAERCHKIVHSLLSFARQHPPERKLTNVNAIIDSVVEILIYELRTSNIQVVRELSPQLPRLLADPHQLQQVFLNIVNNARQAIEAYRPRGVITISTRAEGRRVRVRFQDDGPGISEENLQKIFNPFFTTKPVGKGTGLGLSLSYGIIQEHGGTITAESTPGQGTTFIIDLPITNQPEAAAPEAAPAAPQFSTIGKGRKILVVDDEEDILGLVTQILLRQGYEVQGASDGQSALVHLGRNRFDLIISDWKMPGLSGQQLYQRLLETNPEAAMKMIFMTGDVLSEKTEKYLSEHGKTCLTKPFSVAEFQQVVGEIFQRAP